MVSLFWIVEAMQLDAWMKHGSGGTYVVSIAVALRIVTDSSTAIFEAIQRPR